jgi:hypothetical protein
MRSTLPRHGRQVNAFGHGAALDVGNVGLENLLENLQRAITVGPGEHPGMQHAT